MGGVLLTGLKIIAALAALTTVLIALFAVMAGILGAIHKATRGGELGRRPGRLERRPVPDTSESSTADRLEPPDR
jgi:hypothetical protein